MATDVTDADIHLIPDNDPAWTKVMTSREMSDKMASIAAEFKPMADSRAPVQFGTYQRSLKVERGYHTVNGITRAAGFISSDDPLAWAKNWGRGANRHLPRISKIMRSLR